MAEYSQLLDDYPHWKNFLSTKATKPSTSIKGWHTGTIQGVLHQKMSLETCPTTVPQNFEKNWENNPTQPFSTTHRMDPPRSLFLHAGAFSLFGRNHLFYDRLYWNACVYSRLPSLWVYLPLHIVFPRTSGQALMSPLPRVSPHPLCHNVKQAPLSNNRPLRPHFQGLTDQEKCDNLRIPNEDVECLMGLLNAWLPTIALTNEIH